MGIHIMRIIRMRVILIGIVAFWGCQWTASADTKRVTFDPKKPLIGTLGTYVRQTCQQITTDVEVKTQPKHGRLTVRTQLIDLKAPCKGHKLRVWGFFYTPQRGFKGKDQAVISYREPPRTFFQGDSVTTMMRTRKFIINVK